VKMGCWVNFAWPWGANIGIGIPQYVHSALCAEIQAVTRRLLLGLASGMGFVSFGYLRNCVCRLVPNGKGVGSLFNCGNGIDTASLIHPCRSCISPHLVGPTSVCVRSWGRCTFAVGIRSNGRCGIRPRGEQLNSCICFCLL
jgi:hypothetical protein